MSEIVRKKVILECPHCEEPLEVEVSWYFKPGECEWCGTSIGIVKMGGDLKT